MEVSVRNHALESGAFVVNATAGLDQQAQIMADTVGPIGPVSGGLFNRRRTQSGIAQCRSRTRR
jgi:nitrilase